MKIKNCSVCGVAFSCGVSGDGAPCWCEKLPAIMPLEFGQDCRCPACLKNIIKEKIEQHIQTNTTAALIAQAKKYSNNKALVEAIDYYVENGAWVFTEWYHLKRGHCCGNGCRHCPY